MENWPVTLPQNFMAGASIGDDESRAISQMDTGPASVRNRFTAISQTAETNMILTGAQLVTFNTFMRTTLQHGTLPFIWINPMTGDSEILRFKKKPKWQCIAPSPVVNDRLWQASLELEILP